MFHLVIVVMSIALMALVVAGGGSTLKPDFAVRQETTERVSAQFRSLDSAFAAYSVANRGAMPRADDWMRDIEPYRGPAMQAPLGLAWSYGVHEGVRFLCLSGPSASEAQFAGLQAAWRRIGGDDGDPVFGVVGACPGGVEVEDGVAFVAPVRSGG